MDSQSKLILFNCNEDYELKLYTEDNLKNLDTDDIIQIREFSELRLLLNSNDSDYFEMPEMDGYRLTTEVRKDPRLKDLYVVMHTSLSGSFNQAMVEKVGCDKCLSKLQPEKLVDVMVDRLERDSH